MPPKRLRATAVAALPALRWASADAAAGQNCTPLVSAPSTTRLVPVMKLAAGLARKAHTPPGK